MQILATGIHLCRRSPLAIPIADAEQIIALERIIHLCTIIASCIARQERLPDVTGGKDAPLLGGNPTGHDHERGCHKQQHSSFASSHFQILLEVYRYAEVGHPGNIIYGLTLTSEGPV